MKYLYNRISYYLNGEHRIALIPPGKTTLRYLHEELGMFGSKCSCNEGDCGACTVVIAYPKEGKIVYEAINSCLYPAARLHGKHLITIEALGTPEHLHPIQQAMLDFHATQCGYCSPGFVMSAFALFAANAHPDTEQILAALEGNLCRCTGYDSILKAMLALSESDQEMVAKWVRELEPQLFAFKDLPGYAEQESTSVYRCGSYRLPQDLEQLWLLLASHRDARLICGGTDIMVQANIGRQHFPTLIDLSFIRQLRRIYFRKDGIHIGANSTYTDLYESGIVMSAFPAMRDLITLIASRQIRNSGTVVGNIANASPIGDSMPLLLVLGASLVLSSENSERILPLKDYFISYKQTALREGEIITELILPPTSTAAFIRIKKAAKRKSVDISAIASAIKLELDAQGRISSASLAFGGAAEIPKLSSSFSGLVLGKCAAELEIEAVAEQVASEFSPIGDVRGSAEYRRLLIRNQLMSYLLDLQGRLS